MKLVIKDSFGMILGEVTLPEGYHPDIFPKHVIEIPTVNVMAPMRIEVSE